MISGFSLGDLLLGLSCSISLSLPLFALKPFDFRTKFLSCENASHQSNEPEQFLPERRVLRGRFAEVVLSQIL